MAYPFPRPLQYVLKVKRGTSGLGVFASEDIPKNRFIVEYWGKLMPDAKAQNIGGRYLFELGNGKTIDGATRKNIARYINHACKPNAEVRIVGDRIYIYSLKKIKAGAEITYDYDTEYFDYFIKPHGCRCATCLKKATKKKTPKK